MRTRAARLDPDRPQQRPEDLDPLQDPEPLPGIQEQRAV